uniref:Uncharacterized protein n=1 Tax=Solanum tuberosum TaxID=4113 RepID=M1CG51_SOLTU
MLCANLVFLFFVFFTWNSDRVHHGGLFLLSFAFLIESCAQFLLIESTSLSFGSLEVDEQAYRVEKNDKYGLKK